MIGIKQGEIGDDILYLTIQYEHHQEPGAVHYDHEHLRKEINFSSYDKTTVGVCCIISKRDYYNHRHGIAWQEFRTKEHVSDAKQIIGKYMDSEEYEEYNNSIHYYRDDVGYFILDNIRYFN